jgi:diguanylate cyclase (GGDEF)-like protein
MSGEEMVVVLPDCGIENALKRADAIQLAIAAGDVLHEGRRIGATASIGVASYPQHGNDMQGLVHAADLALYEAKHDGRNCVLVAKQAAHAGLPAAAPPQGEAGRS